MGEKDEGCKCSTATARTWLIVFNSAFVILGLAVAAAGGVLLWGRDLVSSYLSAMLDEVSVEGSSLNDLLQTVGIALLLLGVVLTAVGFMGCCGGCCLVRCCLLVYSMVMIKLLVLEITAVIVWFVMRDMLESRVKDALLTAIDTFYAGDTATDAVSLGFNFLFVQLESRVKDALLTAIDTFYAGDTATDAVSLGFNFLFVQLDCCGITNYTNLHTASSWNRTSGGSTLDVPYTCCKLDGTFPNVVIPPADVYCAVTPNVTNSNYDTACYDAFFDYISSYQFIFIIIGVCLVVCEICSAVSSIILKKHAAQQDKRVDSVPATPVTKTRPKDRY